MMRQGCISILLSVIHFLLGIVDKLGAEPIRCGSQDKCCRLGCDKLAEWAIYDEDVPMEGDTYSCSDCLGVMLSFHNYVTSLHERGEK